MGKFWIESTDNNGENWSARWHNVNNEQVDSITNFIESLIGKPDTTA